MKKIPTLFVRIFDEHHNKSITREVTPGMEWVLGGEGVATVKIDGSCCAIMDGKYYKRYDAKKGKQPPAGAVPCCDPDPITGHWPHWVEVNADNPGDRWHSEAYRNTCRKTGNSGTGSRDGAGQDLTDGSYEAIGPHFRDNPYGLDQDILVKHGEIVLNVPRTFDGLKEFLRNTPVEGLVFWKDGEAQCKIKRSDFDFPWPVPEAKEYFRSKRTEHK